jgi:hypothetical protein
MSITPDDLTKLRTVEASSYAMRRGVTAAWIGRMISIGLVRHRRACEANGWMADIVLTREGQGLTAAP